MRPLLLFTILSVVLIGATLHAGSLLDAPLTISHAVNEPARSLFENDCECDNRAASCITRGGGEADRFSRTGLYFGLSFERPWLPNGFGGRGEVGYPGAFPFFWVLGAGGGFWYAGGEDGKEQVYATLAAGLRAKSNTQSPFDGYGGFSLLLQGYPATRSLGVGVGVEVYGGLEVNIPGENGFSILFEAGFQVMALASPDRVLEVARFQFSTRVGIRYYFG